MLNAVKVELDPTPAQERLLSSHASAARIVFNASLDRDKARIEAEEKPEWSLQSVRRWRNQTKDLLAVDSNGRHGGGGTARKPTTADWKPCRTP